MKSLLQCKLKLLVLGVFLMSSFALVAQDGSCPNNLLLNGDFSLSSCGGGNAFQSNCVTNWDDNDGSPSLHGYPGNPYAWMWSYGGNGEAISANFNFVAGTSYDISFRVRTDDLNTGCDIVANFATINLIATNTPGNVTGSPSGEAIFQSPAAPYLNTWTTITTTYTAVASSTKLWVFPYMLQTDGTCQVEMSIDDICITEAIIINNEGAYCCDETDNLIANGNFEAGNTDFNSAYTFDSNTLPERYDVTTDASLFGATVTDHSFCEDPTTYAANDTFMLVNGLTNQPAGAQSVIWEQTLVGLDSAKEYRFCGNFKNLPQCTFDVLPEITVSLSNGYSETITVSADPTDPCDWNNLSFCFSGQEKIVIQITLNEDSLGDGNDLAIDDLSVQELRDPNLNISVLHQGEPQEVTGSINTIDPSDDALPYSTEICDEPWYWYVLTVDSYSGGTFTIDFSDSYGWGNDTGGSSIFNPAATGPNWDLTTTFPGFPFDDNKLYLVGMYTPSCCNDCVDDGFTYQLILNNREMDSSTMSDEDKKRVIEILGTYQNPTSLESKSIQLGQDFKVYPNPAKDFVNVTLANQLISEVNIYNVSGRQVMHRLNPSKTATVQIDVSTLSTGLYFLHSTDSKQNVHIKKLLIE
ncbi:MAG: T9SS type A sorting domain-containing protein [Gilvibacter sp.]